MCSMYAYLEVKHGAPKFYETRNAFSPERGLLALIRIHSVSRRVQRSCFKYFTVEVRLIWWINHHFRRLNVIANKKISG